jgi:ribosomal protein L23
MTRMGMGYGKRTNRKQAVVTLREGDSIEVFK